MPTSDYHHITDVLHIVEQLRPKSILDVGMGFGLFGYLYRQILELYQGIELKKSGLVIDGIEICDKLRNPLWDMAYDRVFIGDALDILDKLARYDLITACDIIEHFSKQEGRLLIEKMLSHADTVIITSPRSFIETSARFENTHDIHKSLWSREDFKDFPHIYKDISFTFMVILSLDKEALKSINILHPLDPLGVKKGFYELMKLSLKKLKIKTKCLLH